MNPQTLEHRDYGFLISVWAGMTRVAIVALMVLQASLVSAQVQADRSFVPDVVKSVLLDPTTYIPAIVTWEATRLDWRSSQIFFQNGFLEHNPGFTISGRGDDTAIGYAAGNRQILTDAFSNLPLSILNNVAAQMIERPLRQRYPNHPKLIRSLGWIERSAIASYFSYRLSVGHFRQWEANKQHLAQLGLE